MGASVKVQQFVLRTTNGTTDITVASAGTCKGAIFIVGGGITNGTLRDHAKIGVGWVDSSGNQAIGSANITEHDVGTTDTACHWSATSCIGVMTDDAASIDGVYTYSAFITDGIRITTSNPAGQAYLCTAILFFGSDTTCVNGSITPTSSTVNVETKINIGQDSDFIVWSHEDTTTGADTVISRYMFNLAVSTWDGTTLRQRGARVFASDNKSNSNVIQICGPRLYWNGLESIDRATECTTMSGSEVGITSRENGMPTDRPYRFMSVNFNGKIEARVEALDVPTSSNLASTAYGFKPQAMFFTFIHDTVQKTEANSMQIGTDNETIVGGMDGTREFAVSNYDDDVKDTTITASFSNNNVLFAANGSSTTLIDGDFSTFDTNGFTITMNTNPGAVHAGFGVAFEEEATGASHDYLAAHAVRLSSNRRLRM